MKFTAAILCDEMLLLAKEAPPEHCLFKENYRFQ